MSYWYYSETGRTNKPDIIDSLPWRFEVIKNCVVLPCLWFLIRYPASVWRVVELNRFIKPGGLDWLNTHCQSRKRRAFKRGWVCHEKHNFLSSTWQQRASWYHWLVPTHWHIRRLREEKWLQLYGNSHILAVLTIPRWTILCVCVICVCVWFVCVCVFLDFTTTYQLAYC